MGMLRKIFGYLGWGSFISACLCVFGFHLYTTALANLQYGAFVGTIVFFGAPFSDFVFAIKEFMARGVMNSYFATLGCALSLSLIGAIFISISGNRD